MFAVVYTAGEMTTEQIRSECTSKQFAPILTYRIGEAEPKIPIFHDSNTTRKFIKRNLPKAEIHGGVDLVDDDLARMVKLGWKLEPMSYPKRIADIPGLTFGLEVFEFEVSPDVYFR